MQHAKLCRLLICSTKLESANSAVLVLSCKAPDRPKASNPALLSPLLSSTHDSMYLEASSQRVMTDPAFCNKGLANS